LSFALARALSIADEDRMIAWSIEFLMPSRQRLLTVFVKKLNLLK